MKRLNLNLLFYLLMLNLVGGCATGSSIVVGEVKPSIEPSQVSLYLKPPEEYEIIGIVKASSNSGLTEQGSVEYAIEELKSQAAKIGANGVLIESTGQNSSTYVGGQGTAETITGKAIYIAP